MSAAVFFERSDPGRLSSPLLALAVHLLLAAFLVFGVRWQNRPPETVTAELWDAPRPAPEPAPALKVEPPPPAPKPEPRAEPPPPPKPAPRIEKPDIAVKEPAKPKPVPPKPVAKPAPLKPRVDEAQKRMQEAALARELNSLAIDREQAQMREQLAREAASASAKALAGWIDKVRAKIRGYIVLPPDIKGNPEAIFDVVQLPTGEVLSAKLRKSSGHPGYDAAVERAILKSSPLPRPDKPELFQRSLELRFRPLDPI